MVWTPLMVFSPILAAQVRAVDFKIQPPMGRRIKALELLAKVTMAALVVITAAFTKQLAVEVAQVVRAVMEELTRVLGVMAEMDLHLTPLLMLVVAAVRQ